MQSVCVCALLRASQIISVRPDRNEASSMQDVLLRASEALNHSYNNAEGVPKSLEEAAAMLPESKVRRRPSHLHMRHAFAHLWKMTAV